MCAGGDGEEGGGGMGFEGVEEGGDGGVEGEGFA